MVVKADNSIVFGIGCFHFRYSAKPPFTLEPTAYLAEIKKALQALPSVTNLEVTDAVPGQFFEPQIKKGEAVPRIRDRGGPFPGFLGEKLQFDLFIPTRLQNHTLPAIAHSRIHESERYRVTILDAFHIAVSFVEVLDARPGDMGSDAVKVVREFLEKAIAEVKNRTIEFEFLGPSPFHVDCWLMGPPNTMHDEMNDPAFDCDSLSGPYDELRFRYNTAAFDSIDEAKSLLFREIAEEVSLYYHIVQNESAKMTDWETIDGRVQRVIQLYQRKGPIGWLARTWSASREINETFVALAEFEALSLAWNGSIQSSFRQYKEISSTNFFQPYIERQLEEQHTYPVQQSIQLITMFESRRLKGTEIAAVIVGAILGFFGGVGGAVLTRILTP